MGSYGVVTRILGPARGAFLTYAALDEEHASAPGQLGAAELRELYRVNQLDRQTEVMGLVGSPVAHSLSPHMHNAAFAAAGLNAVYVPFDVRDAAGFLRRMIHPRTREIEWNLRGLSVTTPHKTDVMESLDAVEGAAREIGAVNTVVVEEDGLRGYNTDAAALVSPLRERGTQLAGARCAILGAGGAARAALWGLAREGARLTLFARDIQKALPVAEKFGAACVQFDGASFDGFDLVVNATPLGTRGHAADETVAVAAQLRGARVAYDLVYNPAETRFMRAAHEAACAHVVGGLSMLVAQAAAQFELWTRQSAPREAMRAAAEKQLSEVRG
jgi:3-dehydroquinate dehydratase/shikimate dehydrogenase